MKNICALLSLVTLLSITSCASTAKKIDTYEYPKKALLVIDMQIDYIAENAKYPIEKAQIGNLIVTINDIINEYNSKNIQIIYLRNIFRKNNIKNISRNYASIEGSLGIEIDPRINIYSENIFDKYTPDAFSSIDFENYLIKNQINELYLCGVMADQCVYETALSAFNRGYIVNYYSNAVGSLSVKNIEKTIVKLRKKGINIIEF
jgi:nicotinamidase-related amidase